MGEVAVPCIDFVHYIRRSLYVITEDIAKFFDHITADQVHPIWREFFAFGEEVSVLLTQITTKDGKVRLLLQGEASPYRAEIPPAPRVSALDGFSNLSVKLCSRLQGQLHLYPEHSLSARLRAGRVAVLTKGGFLHF
jgi:hypothetical protein